MAAAAAVGFSTSATAWRMPSISERAAALRAAFRDAVDQVRVRVAAVDPGDRLTVAEKRARGPSRPRRR